MKKLVLTILTLCFAGSAVYAKEAGEKATLKSTIKAGISGKTQAETCGCNGG